MAKKVNCIMLIDDNPDDNFFHKRVINKSECANQVIVFQSGQEALDYMKTHEQKNQVSPDLVFLDINMPGMTGWEFLEEYDKTTPSSSHHMVLIILTTSNNPDDINRTRSTTRASEHHTKPLTKEMLSDIIDKYF
ncbi:hypothetical protein BFP72_04680 [Reichenbachiella sp. 5M10]|uniref:response regulator n=1 Tax=Reichenbachiella sp. 5M10 TaxID=1889772 RepID=UPI000C147ED3|nr:response regulator [Reichenbachiella sp. 5M10]PIB34751.1 hypothetical protein BFP72_04680 [Reichenbachiella sp. 5M10]